mmetsp:Transcript_7395/g.18152  ORF Transcript_7395/g.18152 Transcript_7395/m.18152 type:complete len:255 (+) Transcript_7395:278-1042(+)
MAFMHRMTLSCLTVLAIDEVLYFSYFSAVIMLRICSSERLPWSLKSAIMFANFLFVWSSIMESGSSTSSPSTSAFSMALLMFSLFAFSVSSPSRALISTISSSTVLQDETFWTNSSSRSGKTVFFTASSWTPNTALRPLSSTRAVLSGNSTTTSFSSPTFMPTMPSTKPFIYLPTSMLISTDLPSAISGSGSPREPSSRRWYPIMEATQTVPSSAVAPSGAMTWSASRLRISRRAFCMTCSSKGTSSTSTERFL